MCLKNPSAELLEKEKQIQVIINNHIDNFSHIKFNAGAGAGKTHALKESLLYIVNKHGNKLKDHNQQILCITYTNVATNEIKERIGNSSLVKVSTIHERVWELIKDYQKELVQIHQEKVSNELNTTQAELNNTDNAKYRKFQSLDASEQEQLIRILLDNRELYYKNKDKSAPIFKTAFNTIVDNDLMSNVGQFKDIIKAIYKIENFQICLEKIVANEYKSVIYDSTQNNDSLHRMKISHDTLLEYGFKIVDRYDTLKKIIINKFPYILIDEYQDTAEKVIKIINSLSMYSQQINYNLFIGYFGDTAQNIYDTGVGSNIDEIHPNLVSVDKRFNRRSAKQVIKVINKIRNDHIEQISIYEDDDCGSVEFYQGSEDKINDFITRCKVDLNISGTNKLHCFVLKNELVAKYNGFENIYNSFKNTILYSGLNYQNLNIELVTYDKTKLGDVQNLIYKIIELQQSLINLKTPISDILNEKIYEGFNFKELFDLIELLKSISGNTLKEYIETIFNYYEESEIKGYKQKVEDVFKEIDTYSLENLVSFMLEKLYRDIDDEQLDDAKTKIERLLSIPMTEYIKWFEFVNRVENQEVIYHTYHGTKGLEFNNVVVIMENSFTRNDNKFSTFFSNLNNEDENTKNLLYVACSRARKNLRIFYLDDITSFKDGIKTIFGEIYQFINIQE
ncbi:ATP-dependent helicase [Aliarcobacter butzleri]|uniref:ATP-dependent helicase n=1 Tax=Aliarcobacter butzleri TaxID=28197 RepID=UPI00344CB75E